DAVVAPTLRGGSVEVPVDAEYDVIGSYGATGGCGWDDAVHRITGGNESGVFGMDPNGRLWIADHSALVVGDVWNLDVELFSEEHGSLRATVTVTVIDGDIPLMFSGTPAAYGDERPSLAVANAGALDGAWCAASTPTGVRGIGFMLAFDPDTTRPVVYGLVGGATADAFAVDTVSGEVFADSARLAALRAANGDHTQYLVVAATNDVETVGGTIEVRIREEC
ncbi:MAG: hypothetical protein R3290_12665, partial [Acidimicrobiia bacterium]|nr:hypothetical protein [Acidimicrobiia bacterium]